LVSPQPSTLQYLSRLPAPVAADLCISHNAYLRIGVSDAIEMTLTGLRKSLMRVTGRVLATGAPVRIGRGW